ncbi:centrosomal protein CCDC61 isoform X1 [Gadus macrocephalus]|uniref:centrosomal protein CCDC61 isoform X1 n=1 Tax=Gadus macrocephalus TaxID=80720 RepID=UPI0028CB7C13|nr:centrosomal protein CCDC61 isoform X1 [Gadus macrocephalus]
MEASSGVEEDLVFRGVEFSVKVEMENGLLVVEISDVKTADQWRGEFDPAYIEDLTRKTGNFKQFPIFCSMLESAVRQVSDSVTLDLLTYADLELLRNRKAGVVGRPRGGQQSPALGAKRYLILIYTVEFDRIHYPLPVPYKGKPDPAALQREIRALRTQLSATTSQGGPDHAHPETQRLRAELAQVREEKQALAHALQRLQGGGAGGREAVRRSREALRDLEEQLLKEQAKGQRSASRRSQEQRLLVEQLEELRESESALRVRVKDLTSELASLRRGRATPVYSGGSRADIQTHRSLSRERTGASRERGSVTRERGSLSRDRGPGGLGVRARSGSRERADDRVLRSGERRGRADSSGPRAHIPRPSPSPTGSGGLRFDPTAYIQDRQRRLKEADLKKLRKTRRDMLASPVLSERGRSRSREHRPLAERSGSRGRSLSTERRGSRPSSAGSVVDEDHMTGVLLRGRKPVYNGASASRGIGSLGRKPLCSTPTYRRREDRESSMDAGTELSEIDARLQALQDYMRDLDTGP